MAKSNKMVYQPHNSSLGNTDARMILLVVYLGPILIGMIPEIGSILAWILPLVILFVEKGSHLVRFSAAQSFVLSVAVAIIQFVLLILAVPLTILTFGIGGILMGLVVWVVNIISWLLLAYAAYLGFAKWTAWEIPGLFPFAHKLEKAIGGGPVQS